MYLNLNWLITTMCIPLLLHVCTRIILLFFTTLSQMDQLIWANEEQHYFENTICELYLGSPEQPECWGPRQYSQLILNLFWTPNIKYTERFKLATFVQNNPLPRFIFYRWIDHIGQCRDNSARNHIESCLQLGPWCTSQVFLVLYYKSAVWDIIWECCLFSKTYHIRP